MFLNIAATFIICFYCVNIISALSYGNNILHMWEGESCPHPSGFAGTCRHVSQCPEAMSVIGKKESVKICSFQGLYPIICCLERQSRIGGPYDKKSKSLIACETYNKKFPVLISYSILKGEDAAQGEFPHMAALKYITSDVKGTEYKCAGTLISDRFVLTAAHCITDAKMGTLSKVRLGGLSLSSINEGAQEYSVDKTYVHPKSGKGGVYNDIGLLRLSEKVKFRKTIMPACLLNEDNIPENELTISGWGSTDSLGIRFPDTLMKTTVELVDLHRCNETYFDSVNLKSGITEDMLCVRDPKGMTDTCAGDSGAPAQLRMRFNKVYTVAGVLSLGPSPCGGATPSVYSRVSRYLSWIEDIVWR